jgi:hypothetical protein
MQSFLNWFIGEGGAGWIIGALSIIWGVYKWYSQQQGGHVYCRQVQPSLSALSLASEVRKSIIIYYREEGKKKPIPVDKMSYTLIEITFESSAEALNSINLKFQIVGSRILGLWWQSIPPYLEDRSKKKYFLVNPLPDEQVPTEY